MNTSRQDMKTSGQVVNTSEQIMKIFRQEMNTSGQVKNEHLWQSDEHF